jgi:nucleotide-binding universal stress UspA family protein
LLYNYRILVPIDGSAHSLHALQHAQVFAQQIGERVLVTLLHVNPRILLNELPGSDINIEELIEQESQRILAPAANLLEVAHVKHDMICLSGEPAQTICSTALTGEYGLIIMGSRGLSPLPGAILGSVSNAVLQGSHCPVLIIK